MLEPIMLVTLRNREGGKSRKVVYVFLKGNLCIRLFVYTLISICMFICLDFSYTIYQACISNVYVIDINLAQLCFGTIHKTIYMMKIMDDIVVCI